MERLKRALSLLLCMVMVIGLMPVSAIAATDSTLAASLDEAKSYIDGITLNNSSNDPETVVKNFKTHFTWDNEKRENSKSYLFDWSYYNGVVFEGLEYVYEVTGEEAYKDYVMEYMSSLITSSGGWATCTNNTSKQAAGYNSTHGADCYKTASLLLDAYEMSGDDRYLTMAETLYADLDTAAKSYSLSNCGSNYRHTWSSDPSPDLWLDGLYMILPFRAEYAKYIGDTEELDLIVSRMQWVSDNMYNSSKGLFYHAADSASSNSGTYWLRSIGWYAAAIVDVMDSMDGENLETMKAQLEKLVDGMKSLQNSSNGMWLNNMAASQSSSNPYETSGTALVCYAVMKAVNNGWLDESYADMAILAFNGICNEKLSGSTLTDICFKGAPGSSNSTFYDNEGKGVGPFIMLYAEVLEYTKKEDAPEETVPETTAPAETEPESFEELTDAATGVKVESAEGITGLTVDVIPAEDVQALVADVLTGTLVAYDITVADFVEGSTAAVTVSIPEDVDADKFGVFYIPTEGEPELMEGEASANGETYTFYTTHFSTYVGGEIATAAEEPVGSVSGEGNLPGGTQYVLDTNGVDAGASYLIVSGTSGNVYAFRNNGGSSARQSVSVNNGVATISSSESTCVWTFTASGSSWYISNGTQRIRLSNSDILNNNGQTLTVSHQGSGAYRISNGSYYLRYTSSSWQRNSQSGNVYLFKQETLSGTAVTFSVAPGAAELMVDDTAALTPTITLSDGTAVTSSDIDWSSDNTSVATVSNGVVTGKADGTATITATLKSVNGTALVDPIELKIEVTVRDVELTGHNWTVGTGYTAIERKDMAEHHLPDFSDVSLELSYSDGTSKTVGYEDITFTYTDAVGEQTVTATYVDDVTGETLTTTFPIEVTAMTAETKVMGGTTEFEFVEDTQADFAGLKYTITYDCGCVEVIPYTDLTVTGYIIATPGVYENCPVSYNGEQIGTVKVTVTECTDVTGTGNLVGGKVYVLDTNGVNTNENYLIVNTGSNGPGYALTNNNSNTPGSTEVEISGGEILVTDDSKIAWVFSGATSGTVGNNGRYAYPNNGSLSLSTDDSNMTIGNQNSGAYRIYRTDSSNRKYYIRYNNVWTGTRVSSTSSTTYSVYLYRYDHDEAGAKVIFKVAPGSVGIQPGRTANLVGSVTVDGVSVSLSKCTIAWASGNENYATVENGVVTGVADGQTNVTATLTAVDGRNLKTPIVLSIPVTVATKTVVSTVVTTPSGSVYVGSGDAALTGGKLTLTYDDGSQETIDITLGMLSGTIDRDTVGTYTDLTVMYNGEPVADASGKTDSFVLTVLPKPDANYPEYPNPGSVFVDKYISDYTHFQNAGVAQIELTASGLPAMSGVDVILVTDFSNSMARPTTDANDDGTIDDDDCPTDFTQTKMYDLVQSIGRFAGNFLTGNDDALHNTISMVTFGGYDADHTKTTFSDLTDVTRTLFLGYDDAQDVQDVVNDIRLLKDSSYSNGGFKLSFDGGKNYNGNYGNTNYDYAFMETYNAVNALKAKYQEENGISYDESGRSIYILFMTDGAPTNYDGVYYNYKTDDARPDVNATWIPKVGADESSYEIGINNESYSNANWYSHIAGGAYNSSTGTIPGNPHYWATQVYNLPGVENMFNIGFDTEHGGFSSMHFTENAGYPLNKVLEKMVEGQTLKVYDAEDSEQLKQIYADLATELKLAASKARFIDQMGDDFDLQMANVTYKPQVSDDEITLQNKITVSTYDIYTADDGVADDLIGKRKGEATVLETITFNADGTQAYSDKLSGNILVDGVICAQNFWYNTTADAQDITLADGTVYSLPAETFYWNIGTISNKEFVLSYPVYLEGSREGTAVAGSYETNNYADLHYTNWLNNEAKKSTESPVLAWKSALVNFGFYLVDELGNPVVNRATGQTGTFADAIKVTPKIFYDMIELNSNENVIELSVADHLPYGYEIFDTMAAYKITVDSGNARSRWEITCNPALTNMLDEQIRTTYVTDYDGNAYTNLDSEDLENAGTIDYTSTTVWFAVKYSLSTVPDVVVIDYGLSVDIDVLTNDMLGDAAALVGVGGTDKKPVSDNKQYTATHSADFTNSFTSAANPDDELNAGDIRILDVKAGEAYPRVRYTPNTMEMPDYDKFTYEVAYNDESNGAILYFYGDVTVIPATIIYYEDNFLTYESFHVNTTDYSLTPYGADEESLWQPVGSEVEGATQDEDRPGAYTFGNLDANNIYGYDSAYAECSEYSLGSAMKATVNATTAAHASFTFYGTGFDIISLTDCDAGSIFVDVYDLDQPITDANGAVTGYATVCNYVVDNYYGYVLNHYEQTYTYTQAKGWTITAEELCSEADYENKENNKVIPTEPGTEGQEVIVYRRIYEVDENATDNALYQVPVMKVEGLEYGHYKAVIRASYKSRMYHGQNEGSNSYNFILDAIRIYDPANDGKNDETGMIEYAYGMDGEGWPVFTELRDLLLSAESFDNVSNNQITGAVFIDGNSSIDDDYIMSDYLNFGPNNEVYLAKNQAVAFELDLSGFVKDDKSIVEDVHIALKTENGEDVQYEIYYLDAGGNARDARTYTLNTATDRYYKLPNYDKGVLVIHNAGDGLLSITNLKLTFTEDPYVEEEELKVPVVISSQDANMAVMSLRARSAAAEVPEETVPETIVPETTVPEETVPETTVPEETVPEETEPEETEPEVFEPDSFRVNVNKTSVKTGQKVKVTVTTSQDVAYVTINGEKITRYSGSWWGSTRTWTLNVTADEVGTMEIQAVAFNSEDLASEPVSTTVTVRKTGGLFDWLW